MNDFDFRKKHALLKDGYTQFSIRINYLSKHKYLPIHCNKSIKLFFISLVIIKLFFSDIDD